MNSNDAKTWYNRVILEVNIFSKSSKKQPFSNLFKLIWNLSIDKKVVLMAEPGTPPPPPPPPPVALPPSDEHYSFAQNTIDRLN